MINSLKDLLPTKFRAEKNPRKCTGRKRITPKKQSPLFSHKSASAYKETEYLVGKKQLLLKVFDKVDKLKIESSQNK